MDPAFAGLHVVLRLQPAQLAFEVLRAFHPELKGLTAFVLQFDVPLDRHTRYCRLTGQPVTVGGALVFFQAHKIPKVHCTLIYLGESMHPSRQPLLEEAAQRLGHAMRGPGIVRVKGLAVYGQGTHTVMELDDYVLKSYRHFIDKELSRSGIRSASQYSYNPHVTINKHGVSSEPILPWDGFQIPPEIMIDRPQVWWD